MHHPDICIAGAGIIGLSLALELHHRGLRVTVLDRSQPLAEASTAAAGMLAAADPDNPPPLRPLADLSLSLSPAFAFPSTPTPPCKRSLHTSTPHPTSSPPTTSPTSFPRSSPAAIASSSS